MPVLEANCISPSFAYNLMLLIESLGEILSVDLNSDLGLVNKLFTLIELIKINLVKSKDAACLARLNVP